MSIAHSAPTLTDPPALSVSGVTVKFGGVTALSDVSLEVPNGQVVGLIGPNGAGKSTLLGVISGFLRPAKGTVSFNGDNVSALAPHARARLGLARTFQQPELFADLSVRDHMVVAFRTHHQRGRLISDLYTGRGLSTPAAAETARVDAIIDLLGMSELADRKVLGLSLGASRLVEVGRALAMGPKLLLLDEPSSGLDRWETDRLRDALSRVVSEEGVSLIMVEHDVELVLGLSNSVSVLDFGLCIASGTPAEIRNNPQVRDAYLGAGAEVHDANPEGQASAPATKEAPISVAVASGESTVAASGETLLEVEHLSVFYGPAQALDDLSLRMAAGSAVAVLGVNGAGKSTLSRALSGLVPTRSGKMFFAGVETTGVAAHKIRNLGLAYLPEGRGIFPGLSVVDNLKMAVQMVPRRERQEAIARAIEFFPVLGERGRQLAGSLSGGEQQMLSLARALAVDPRLIIADELSLGLAPKVIDAVFEGLERARQSGISVIVIEQFIQRALDFCDYAYILRRGVICWEGEAHLAAEGAADHYLGTQDPVALEA
jgi:branched-chain amino acid transport system ATP-binding protein